MKKILCAMLCLGMLMGCSGNAGKKKYEGLVDKGITYSKMPIEFTGSFDAFILNDKNNNTTVTLYDQYKNNTLETQYIVYTDENEGNEGIKITLQDGKVPEKINYSGTNEMNQMLSFNKWLDDNEISSEELMDIFNYIRDDLK